MPPEKENPKSNEPEDILSRIAREMANTKAMQGMAILFFHYYTAMVQAGFKEQQALYLVGEMQKSFIANIQAKGGGPNK